MESKGWNKRGYCFNDENVKTMVKFSVVIPAYNSAWCIRRCLDSVLNQTYKDWEALVIDNYSEDGTFDIINGYKDSRIRGFQIHNNGIIAASRNKGIKEAQGEWICFLDSDDWWCSDKLKELEKWTMQNDFLYHKMKAISNRGSYFRLQGKKCKDDVFTQILTSGNLMCNSSVAVKKQVLEDVGLLSEELALVGVEDCDCWLKIAKKRYKFYFISKPLGYYWLGNNYSVSYEQLKKEELLVEKHVTDLSMDERTLANKNLAFRKGRVLHKLGDYRNCLAFYRMSWKLSFLRDFKILILYVAAMLKKRL